MTRLGRDELLIPDDGQPQPAPSRRTDMYCRNVTPRGKVSAVRTAAASPRPARPERPSHRGSVAAGGHELPVSRSTTATFVNVEPTSAHTARLRVTPYLSPTTTVPVAVTATTGGSTNSGGRL